MSPLRKKIIKTFIGFVAFMMVFDLIFEVENYPFAPNNMYAYKISPQSFSQFKFFFVEASGNEKGATVEWIYPQDPERLNVLVTQLMDKNDRAGLLEITERVFKAYLTNSVDSEKLKQLSFQGVKLYRIYFKDIESLRKEQREKEFLMEYP